MPNHQKSNNISENLKIMSVVHVASTKAIEGKNANREEKTY